MSNPNILMKRPPDAHATGCGVMLLVVTSILVGALTWAAVGYSPMGYYRMLRVIIFFACLIYILTVWESGSIPIANFIVLLMGAPVAVVFNPLWPYYFLRDVWVRWDFYAAGFFSVAAFILYWQVRLDDRDHLERHRVVASEVRESADR